MEIAKLAVEICVRPLHEVIGGEYILRRKAKNKLPVTQRLKARNRFAHMFQPGSERMIEEGKSTGAGRTSSNSVSDSQHS